MNATPQTPATLIWKDLQEDLAGSFTARARGLLANTFLLQKDGEEAGRLLLEGLRGAEFAAETLEAVIERTPGGGYGMFSGEDRILTAGPLTTSADTLEITCGDGVYPACVSFFRNEATASSPRGRNLVQLKGNIVGRRYEVMVDETDAGALPAAILLLYHTAAFRRRVYRA